jgi:hypothetical protein
MKLLAIAVLAPLLASCASSGFYNMSDAWCAKHLSASEARCPRDHERVANNDREAAASTRSVEERTDDPGK